MSSRLFRIPTVQVRVCPKNGNKLFFKPNNCFGANYQPLSLVFLSNSINIILSKPIHFLKDFHFIFGGYKLTNWMPGDNHFSEAINI